MISKRSKQLGRPWWLPRPHFSLMTMLCAVSLGTMLFWIGRFFSLGALAAVLIPTAIVLTVAAVTD